MSFQFAGRVAVLSCKSTSEFGTTGRQLVNSHMPATIAITAAVNTARPRTNVRDTTVEGVARCVGAVNRGHGAGISLR